MSTPKMQKPKSDTPHTICRWIKKVIDGNCAKHPKVLLDFKSSQDLAILLGTWLKNKNQPLIITLSGPLGAGKTYFIKGLAQGLGLAQNITIDSPTFTYFQDYPTHPPLQHFDLYRLNSPSSFFEMGFDELLELNCITCIEWPERLGNQNTWKHLYIEISHHTPENRFYFFEWKNIQEVK
jgi:tRNA threonylcarbamoyladenosine biosynthesis protein TsaE